MDHCKTFGLENEGLFYGTYKGQVVDNQDPDGQGKLKVHCPTIHGDTYPDTWAWPISPFAGRQFGFFAIPDKDEWVWVVFDHGRPEYPIWSGGWWGDGDPTSDMVPTNVVLAVKEGLKVILNRQDKSILIQKDAQNSILIDDNGITIITNKDVKVTAQGDVDVKANNVNVDAQAVKITAQSTEIDSANIKMVGQVEIEGDLHTTGTNLTDGINSAHHQHAVVLGVAIPGDP